MSELEPVPVVTCFLRSGSDVLLLRRSDAVGSYAGRWGAVAGHVARDPDAGAGGNDAVDDDRDAADDGNDAVDDDRDAADDGNDAADDGGDDAEHGGSAADDDGGVDPAVAERAARREIAEETGLADAVSLVRAGDPFAVEDTDRGIRWLVHPFLFESDSRAVSLDAESTAAEWVSPLALRERETVPELRRSYAAVAPTVETVRTDDEHGATHVAMRALEVLRDRAGGLTREGSPDDWTALAALGSTLRAARPELAAVGTRVDRAMAAAAAYADAMAPVDVQPGTPEAVVAAASAELSRATAAGDRIADALRDDLGDATVATLSRSGTVRAALRGADPAHVLVAESRPGGEGATVAADLADVGLAVTLCSDAAAPGLVCREDGPPTVDAASAPTDCVLLGADAVAVDPSGPEGVPEIAVRNKVGTAGLAAAAAAARRRVPVYVAADEAKVVLSAGDDAGRHRGTDLTAAARHSGWPAPSDRLRHHDPTFEATPFHLVDAVVTEGGVLDRAGLAAVAERHDRFAGWVDAAEDTAPTGAE